MVATAVEKMVVAEVEKTVVADSTTVEDTVDQDTLRKPKQLVAPSERMIDKTSPRRGRRTISSPPTRLRMSCSNVATISATSTRRAVTATLLAAETTLKTAPRA